MITSEKQLIGDLLKKSRNRAYIVRYHVGIIVWSRVFEQICLKLPDPCDKPR